MKQCITGYSPNKTPFRNSIERHLGFFLKYLTIKKTINLLLAFIEFKFKLCNCKSFPIYIRFEISSVCNLKCQGCPLGGAKNGNVDKKKNAFVTFYEFINSIKDFIPYLLKVNLYHIGEPFLNKDIYKMISYLHNNNICTCVSSNFSLNFTDQDFVNMIESKLDHLVIAINGIDQESYSSYRLGGDFNLVISNIKRLNFYIKKYNSSLKIESQYIEFPDSYINMREKVNELAFSLNVWKHTVFENGSRKGLYGNFYEGSQDDRRNLGCYFIWFSGSISVDYKYYCCCFGEDYGMSAIGNAKSFKNMNLHNDQGLIELRKSFKKGELNGICMKCPLIAKKSLHNM